MTERLYYTDPYCREFEATVERIEERDGRTTVRLDRTAFYPTSGGQPFDTGLLGPHRVTEVMEDDDGTIVHVLEEHLADPVDGSGAVAEHPPEGSASPRRLASLVGERVHGIIDWTRRFDHMQQHTGQHVLSAACERMCAAPTVAFHLGADASTIDLARELSPGDLAAAETEANRIVWDNRPVAIRFVSADDASARGSTRDSARTIRSSRRSAGA